MKKVLFMVLVAIMLLSIAACTQDEADQVTTAEQEADDSSSTDSSDATDDSSDQVKIGVIVKAKFEYYDTLCEGASAAAEEMGATIKIGTPTSLTNLAEQAQMVEDFIASGIDILLVAPTAPDSLLNVLKQADEAGVKIVCVDSNAPDFENKVTFIGTDNEEAAKFGGEQLSEILGPDANIVILRGALGDTNMEARTKGWSEALEAGGENILEIMDCESSAEKATATMEDLLLKYVDEINAVACTNDDMALGAVQAINEAGLTGEILVCGFDGNQSAVQKVADGEMLFTLAQNPYKMGYDGVITGLAALDGEEFDSFINSGINVIDASNAAEYLE